MIPVFMRGMVWASTIKMSWYAARDDYTDAALCLIAVALWGAALALIPFKPDKRS